MSFARSVRRLATLMWCLAMVTVLGLGWRADVDERLARGGVGQGAVALDADSGPAPVLGPPLSAGELGEDAESESSDDNVVHPDPVAHPQAGSQLAIAEPADRLAVRRSQALERHQHNRGPPV